MRFVGSRVLVIVAELREPLSSLASCYLAMDEPCSTCKYRKKIFNLISDVSLTTIKKYTPNTLHISLTLCEASTIGVHRILIFSWGANLNIKNEIEVRVAMSPINDEHDIAYQRIYQWLRSLSWAFCLEPELDLRLEIRRSWSHVREKRSSGAVPFLRRPRSPCFYQSLML